MKGAQRTEREGEIERRLRAIFEPLGYRVGPALEWGKASRSWWFFRSGPRYPTESVLCEVTWRPASLLGLTYFASKLNHETLTRDGLPGNAVGISPFDHLVAFLGRAPGEILPDPIPIGRNVVWDSLFERIGEEARMVESTVWDHHVEIDRHEARRRQGQHEGRT